MFLETADCSDVKGWVVPRNSATVVPAVPAAGAGAAAEAGLRWGPVVGVPAWWALRLPHWCWGVLLAPS